MRCGHAETNIPQQILFFVCAFIHFFLLLSCCAHCGLDGSDSKQKLRCKTKKQTNVQGCACGRILLFSLVFGAFVNFFLVVVNI